MTMTFAVKDPLVQAILQAYEDRIEALEAAPRSTGAGASQSVAFTSVLFLGTFPGSTTADLPPPVVDDNILRIARLDRKGLSTPKGDQTFMESAKGDGTKEWLKIAESTTS